MASLDQVKHRPKVHLDWKPNFSFAHEPSREPPYSPAVPSPRTIMPRTQERPRHGLDVKEASRVKRGVTGRTKLPNSPLSPIHKRERHRPEDLQVDIPPSTRPLPSAALPTPDTASTRTTSPTAREGARPLPPSNLPESEAFKLEKSPDRQESAPATGEPSSASTIHPELQQIGQYLRTIGDVYLDAYPDIFVRAVPLHRNSHPDSAVSVPPIKEEPVDEDSGLADAKPPATPDTSPWFSNNFTVRAYVQPRSRNSKGFSMKRKFNREELRNTIPDPPSHRHPPSRRSSIAEIASPYFNSPILVGFPPTPLIGHQRRRSTSAKYGPAPYSSLRGRRMSADIGAKVKAAPCRDAKPMPADTGAKVKAAPRRDPSLMPIRTFPYSSSHKLMILTFPPSFLHTSMR